MYLRKKLYTLEMEESKELKKHLDDYNKFILDLNVVGLKIDEKDQAIILLSLLPKVHEHFVDTMMYEKKTFTMNEVESALNSKELQKKESSSDQTGDCLVVRGRTEKIDYKIFIGKSRLRSTSPGKTLKCFKCKKEWHFKRDCPERKKNDT